ncbi:hypothetical protein RRG08_029203 [Elysia crispata]|uniref:Uncharacterized protein n=1 Tax=Elysia crispata TaxID=231223 RepID=A0AAE1AJE1_9GAST|nr:hypothetical protein RRG08_029203 [Elysia crispata]
MKCYRTTLETLNVDGLCDGQSPPRWRCTFLATRPRSARESQHHTARSVVFAEIFGSLLLPPLAEIFGSLLLPPLLQTNFRKQTRYKDGCTGIGSREFMTAQ